MKPSVRVRFAPSPTGPLHIGGVRTALYNYLFAKKYAGSIILRIEDTDQQRYVEGSEAYIIESLTWCGINFDEGPHVSGNYGPYRQSERKDIYFKYAEDLIAGGFAYYAFDTPEELAKIRASFESRGEVFSYNWQNRARLVNSLTLSNTETRQRLASKEDYVIRFKTPVPETLYLEDTIRETIEIDTSTLDDKVLFKSDGMPTYHLANVVDDHLMEITHVIRGEEWLPSLALHRLIYDSLGWQAPQFSHLPLIMKPEGKGKLSKRDGDKLGFPVYPLQWKESPGYRESGYFPEAVVNFLALLGWNPGTAKEIFSMEELIDAFSLDRVQKSGARFDPDKTRWYNNQYLQRKPVEELSGLLMPVIESALAEEYGTTDKAIPTPALAYVQQVVALLKDRASFVHDIWASGKYFFVPPDSFNDKAVRKQWNPDSSKLLSDLLPVLQPLADFSSQHIETVVKNWIADQEISFGKVMAPLRLAMVGDLKGPHLFDIMAVLGKDESLNRLRYAISTLK